MMNEYILFAKSDHMKIFFSKIYLKYLQVKYLSDKNMV